MGILRVYIDTSVFGGYFDEEFADLTRPFFDALFAGTLIPLISDTLIAELTAAPQPIRDLLERVLPLCERLSLSVEVVQLQQTYLRANVVTPKYADDALHVAQATVAHAEVLVSWNFRHLVKPDKVRQYNGINLGAGYGLLFVMTPVDVFKMLEVQDEPDNFEA